MALLYYSEELKKSVDDFANKKEKQVMTNELKEVVANISKIGLPCYPWKSLCPLLSFSLRQSMQHLRNKLEVSANEARENLIISSLESYDAAPFTLQRLCELIVTPDVYLNYNKYINALDKMVNISSTINTLTEGQIQSINKLGRVPSTSEDNCYDFSEPLSSSSSVQKTNEEDETMVIDHNNHSSSSSGDVGNNHSFSDSSEVADTEEIDDKVTPMDM